MVVPKYAEYTDEQIREMKQLREDNGWSWDRIAKWFGTSRHVVCACVDPNHLKTQREKKKEDRRRYNRRLQFGVDKTDQSGGLQPPPDTRDLTGRICGDPLPGRRALDMRGW